MSKFLMVLGVLVLLAVVIFFLSRLAAKVVVGPEEAMNPMAQAAIAEYIKPVGSVNKGKIETGPVVFDPKSVYETVCQSCHSIGVSGAPKLGDKADWANRLAAGIETVYANAINGKGAMPAKGGRADLADADFKKIVDYMVEASK